MRSNPPTRSTPTRARPRLYFATASFSAWMVLLLSGFAFGGAVHLLLLLALALFPWREGAGTKMEP